MKYLRTILKWAALILIVFGFFFLVLSVHLEGQEEVFGMTIMYEEHVRFLRNMAIGYLVSGFLITAGFIVFAVRNRRR